MAANVKHLFFVVITYFCFAPSIGCSTIPYKEGSAEWVDYMMRTCRKSSIEHDCEYAHRLHLKQKQEEQARYDASPEGRVEKAREQAAKIEEAKAVLGFATSLLNIQDQLEQAMTPGQRYEYNKRLNEYDVSNYNFNQRNRCYSACGVRDGRHYGPCISDCNLMFPVGSM